MRDAGHQHSRHRTRHQSHQEPVGSAAGAAPWRKDCRWRARQRARKPGRGRGVSWQEADMSAKPAAEGEPLLDVRAVSAGYGGMPVLHDVAFEGLSGRDRGAGRQQRRRQDHSAACTVARAFLHGRHCHEQPRSVPMTSDQVFGAGLVQVPEGRQLFDRMSVQDNLLMGAFSETTRRPSHAISRGCMRCSRVCRSAGGNWLEACRAASSKCARWRAA